MTVDDLRKRLERLPGDVWISIKHGTKFYNFDDVEIGDVHTEDDDGNYSDDIAAVYLVAGDER